MYKQLRIIVVNIYVLIILDQVPSNKMLYNRRTYEGVRNYVRSINIIDWYQYKQKGRPRHAEIKKITFSTGLAKSLTGDDVTQSRDTFNPYVTKANFEIL